MDHIRVKYNAFGTTVFRYKGSVILYVLPKVIFFLFWSLLIWALDVYVVKYTVLKTIAIPNSLISLLGLVLSLLLVFRTNTAYDRYWEGRRLWSDMTMIVRSTTRTIWVQVEEKDKEDKEMKLQIVQLLLSFTYACKHNIRGEFGDHYDDLQSFSNLLSEPFSPANSKGSTLNSVNKLIKNTFDGTQNDYLPIIIANKLSAYVDRCFYENKISPAVTTTLLNNINTLVNAYTGFERILSTPIPMAYAIHLSQCIWLFCLFLPFQILDMAKNYKYFSVIFTVVSVFTVFGIINIGEEIENPFGYDNNDLPLNEYCDMLSNEVYSMLKKSAPKVIDWVYSKEHVDYIKKTFSIKSKPHSVINVSVPQ